MPKTITIDAAVDPDLTQPTDFGVFDNDDVLISGVTINHTVIDADVVAHEWTVTVPDGFTTGTFMARDGDGNLRAFLGIDRVILAPTAQEIENAVWDALTANHQGIGTMASAWMSGGQSALDRFANELRSGVVSSVVAAFAGADAKVTLKSPVTRVGNIFIVIGDDYPEDDPTRLIAFTDNEGTNWPDLTGATVLLTATRPDSRSTITALGDVTVAVGPGKQMIFPLTREETLGIDPGEYRFAVQVTLPDGDVLTPGRGKLTAALPTS